jgi:hypothetical protein
MMNQNTTEFTYHTLRQRTLPRNQWTFGTWNADYYTGGRTLTELQITFVSPTEFNVYDIYTMPGKESRRFHLDTFITLDDCHRYANRLGFATGRDA